jgi:hypothetical protein
VFDPRTFGADAEPVAHFAFQLLAELASDESRNLVRLHRVNALAKDEVANVFALVNAR